MYWDFSCIIINVSSILGRVIRVTDDVIEYRAWIKETFPVSSYSSGITNQDEEDSLSSTSGSEASTLESGASSDTVRSSVIVYELIVGFTYPSK